MMFNALSSSDNNIPFNGTIVALEHFSKGPVSYEVRVIPDYASPLSCLEVVVRDNNIIVRQLKNRSSQLSFRERVEDLFGEMCDFDERQQELYNQMLERKPAKKKIVF